MEVSSNIPVPTQVCLPDPLPQNTPSQPPDIGLNPGRQALIQCQGRSADAGLPPGRIGINTIKMFLYGTFATAHEPIPPVGAGLGLGC